MSPSVTSFRCVSCGHVWVLSTDGRIHHVTPLKDADQSG
jgi:hypothetical protein